ncbi:MAG: hypothetical protein ACK4IX_08605, partial [Candidatus Sericytochromatia bacterium]
RRHKKFAPPPARKEITYYDVNPFFIQYIKSNDKLDWRKIKYIIPENITLETFKAETPASIEKLSFFSRYISHFIKPDSGMTKTDKYNNSINFKTKSIIPSIEEQSKNFILNNNMTNIENKKLLLRRAEFAYFLFSEWTKLKPKGDDWYDKISINYSNKESNEELNIENTDIFLPGKTLEDKNTGFATTYINTAPDDYSLEREIWHHFQLALFPKDSNQKTKFYDSYVQSNPHNWWIKSSAEYMGALAYKIGSIQNLNDGSRLSYFERDFKHRKYLLDKQLSFPITYSSVVNLNESLNFPNDVEKYLGDYYNWAFFASIDNPKNETDSIDNVINFHKNVETTYYNTFIANNFQNLAIHDFLFDNYHIFDNYNSITLKNFPTDKIEKIILSKNNTVEKDKYFSKDYKLDNFRIKYFDISSIEIPNVTLAIKLITNNSCSENIRINAVYTKEVTKNSTEKYLQNYSKRLPNNYWAYLTEFNSRYDNVNLVVTNSNGIIGNNNSSCDYKLNIGYLCNNKNPLSFNSKGCI